VATSKGPNWGRIKAEYLKGGISYRQLAEKHGVNQSTLEKRAKRESWAEQLRQISGEIAVELPARIKGAVLDEAEQWARETLRIAREARGKLAQQMESGATQTKVMGSKEGPIEIPLPFLNDARDWQAYLKSLAEADRLGRLALGMDARKEDAPDASSSPGDRPSRAELEALDPADAVRKYRETL
jgi:transposase-like protein